MIVKNRQEEIIPLVHLDDLKDAMEELEIKASEQKQAIISNISDIKTSLMPKNLLKAGLSKITGDDNEDVVKNGLKIGGTLVAGFLVKRFVTKKLNERKAEQKDDEQVVEVKHTGIQNSMVGRMLRDAGVALLVANADNIKQFGKAAFMNLFVNKDTKVV